MKKSACRQGLLEGWFVRCLLIHLLLIASFVQAKPIGGSTLGTLNARAPFQPITNNGPYGASPGGSTTDMSYYTNMPNTGKVVSKTLVISKTVLAPDGVERNMLLINDSFPGPLLEANWGDTFNITVINNLDEGTTLHWHGLIQKGTQVYDGVPSVQQCPIAPGGSFTYTFRADQYGTSWYHSHYSSQYSEGLFGPMIIHGPLQPGISYDEDLGPIFLSDWMHVDYFKVVENVLSVHPFNLTVNFARVGPNTTNATVPISENLLINGKNNFDCSNAFPGQTCTENAGLANFNFVAGKTYRLRLINSAGDATLKFSIDEHMMTVFANDFVPVVPYNTSVVTLTVGQRTDVLVTATGKSSSSYYMRVNTTHICSNVFTTEVNAVVLYPDANPATLPNSIPHNMTWDNCTGDALTTTVPFVPLPALPSAFTQTINMKFSQNASGVYHFLMNGVNFVGDYNDPLLDQVYDRNLTFQPNWNVYGFQNHSAMRLVLYNYVPVPHPMHLHGHNMRVLSVGKGTWDGSIDNPANPQRRDVQNMDVGNATDPSYLVIEFDADNPGMWPFHCHIVWHLSGGMYINILELPELIDQKNIPRVTEQTCQAWDAYTARTAPDDIDSGV